MIRYGVVATVLLALAGCTANRNDSAWQFMERQQKEQALVRQYELAQSREQAPGQEELLLQMIQEAQREERYFASLAYIDALILHGGSTPQVLLLKADALRVTGQDGQSEALYRDLLKTSLRAQAHHGLGLLAGGQGQYVRAVEELSAAARLQPARATILSDLGYALLRAGDIGSARLPLGQAAELEPDNGTIVSNLVLFLLLNNEFARAEQVRAEAGLSDPLFRSIASLALKIRAELGASPESLSGGLQRVGHEPLIR